MNQHGSEIYSEAYHGSSRDVCVYTLGESGGGGWVGGRRGLTAAVAVVIFLSKAVETVAHITCSLLVLSSNKINGTKRNYTVNNQKTAQTKK